jgi:hydrogenase nickel incorporation protein HypB
MCTICGCGTATEALQDPTSPQTAGHAEAHTHPHAADHHHADADDADRLQGRHHHTHADGLIDFGSGPARIQVTGLSQERTISIQQDILSKNDAFARANRVRLASAGVFALNLLSSPGSGKTSLLVRTITDLKHHRPICVIEGDQQTSKDADRIRATGAPAVQINTGKGCHLDAHMVGHALDHLSLRSGGLLFVENVGNLVCPAAFDLGEAYKVVVLSVTEGEDKPLKYPDMFAAADLLLLNKADLLPHLEFDVGACIAAALRVNPHLEVLTVSARSGQGLAAFYGWIEARASVMPGSDAEFGVSVDMSDL